MKTTTSFKKIQDMKTRIKKVRGGTGASKTYSILQQWILRGIEDDPEFRGVNSICSESMPHLKRGALRDFIHILKNEGIYDVRNHNRTEQIYTIGNAQYEFFGVDDDSKLRGARRNKLFINEANNTTQGAFDQLEPRTKYGVWLDWNPVASFWGDNLDGDMVVLTFKDNEMLSENEVRSILSRKDNEQWYKVYGRGEIGSVEGLILENWSVIDKVPEDAELICTGLDFGFSVDPSVGITIYRYDGEIICDEILYQVGMTTREMGMHLKKHETSTIYADSAEPRTIHELRTYGLPVQGVKKGPKSVDFGLNLLQDYKLRPTKRSLNLIKSLRNYSWDRDRQGNWLSKPNHAYSDPVDALRYAVVSRLGNKSAQYNVV